MDIKKLNFKIIALVSVGTFVFLLIAATLIASLFPQTRLLAVRFLNKGKNAQEKIKSYENFAEKNNGFIPARLKAAELNMWLGFSSPDNAEYIDRAIETYNRILKKEPNNREALGKLGLINSRQGNFDKAEEYYKKLADLDPTNSTYRLNLARLYFQTDKLNKALEKAKEISEMDPDNYDCYLLKSGIYEKMGDLSSSIYNCKKALTGYKLDRNKQKISSARFKLGQLYAKAGLNINAMQEYERLIKSRPDFLPAYIVLSNIYLKLNAPSKSISLIFNSPLNPLFARKEEVPPVIKAQSYYALGQAYLNKSDFMAARTYFKKAQNLGVEFKPGFFTNLENIIMKTEQEKDLTAVKPRPPKEKTYKPEKPIYPERTYAPQSPYPDQVYNPASPYPESTYNPESPYSADVYEKIDPTEVKKVADDLKNMEKNLKDTEQKEIEQE